MQTIMKVLSYAFAAMGGICLVGGIAVLSGSEG